MGDERGVWIEDGTINIEQAEIEANLHELARRWDMPVEEALDQARPALLAIDATRTP